VHVIVQESNDYYFNTLIYYIKFNF
jgi:hypothetical protein